MNKTFKVWVIGALLWLMSQHIDNNLLKIFILFLSFIYFIRALVLSVKGEKLI